MVQRLGRTLLAAYDGRPGGTKHTVDYAQSQGKEIRLMPELVPEDLLIYHASTGTVLNFEVPSFGGRQMIKKAMQKEG